MSRVVGSHDTARTCASTTEPSISSPDTARPINDSLASQEIATKLGEAIGGTPLYLVGMMGSGKSTVGRLLSQSLAYRYFDTDDLIEKSVGAPVRQIFDENGEDLFRDLETQVLAELSQYARSVISTGGGAVLRTENWGHMRHGIVVWLNGSPATLAARIAGADSSPDEKANRPLLNDAEDTAESTEAELASLLETRFKFYDEADVVVPLEADASEGGRVLSPDELVPLICQGILDNMERKKEEVDAKKDFKIEGIPDTMEVRPPVAPQDASDGAPKGFGQSA